MPGIMVVVLGVLVMLAGLLSHQVFLTDFALFFVPGAILVYYLRARRILLRPASSEIFPVLIAVLLSVWTDALNNQMLTRLAHHPSLWDPTALTVFSSLFALGGILLLEGMLPEVLPKSWALRPGPAVVLATVLSAVAAITGWAVLRWWALPTLAALGAGAWIYYRRVVRPNPQVVSILLFYIAAYTFVMVCAAYAVQL